MIHKNEVGSMNHQEKLKKRRLEEEERIKKRRSSNKGFSLFKKKISEDTDEVWKQKEEVAVSQEDIEDTINNYAVVKDEPKDIPIGESSDDKIIRLSLERAKLFEKHKNIISIEYNKSNKSLSTTFSKKLTRAEKEYAENVASHKSDLEEALEESIY